MLLHDSNARDLLVGVAVGRGIEETGIALEILVRASAEAAGLSG